MVILGIYQDYSIKSFYIWYFPPQQRRISQLVYMYTIMIHSFHSCDTKYLIYKLQKLNFIFSSIDQEQGRSFKSIFIIFFFYFMFAENDFYIFTTSI